MKYKIFFILISISMIFGIYLNFREVKKTSTHQLEYGGILWPNSILYKVDKEGDIEIELQEGFRVYDGSWGAGTKFFFNGNLLKKITPSVPFEFAEINFINKVEIEREDFPPHISHLFKIKEPMIIDGLDLKNGCELEFKDRTLYAGHCDSFGTVYFKRSVELPENAINQE